MACALPALTRWAQTFTGAAHTWFRRKHPGDGRGHFGDDERQGSRFLPFCEPLPVPRRLMSQKTPLARKPCGATTEPGMVLNSDFIRFADADSASSNDR